MRIGEKTQEYMSKFMQDFWKFEKAFWIPEATQDYWDGLIQGANAMSRKYKTNSQEMNNYISELLVSFVSSRDKLLPVSRTGEARKGGTAL